MMTWHFVQACRLIEKKGLETSLRAFANFAAKYPRSKFTIAGEGPLLEQLQRMAGELGVAEKLSFCGFISQRELRDLFYDAHIFLHPSETGSDGNQEGVPNSMLEAMASGLPAFATVHGGIPEAIEDGVSGVLVSEADDAALSCALLAAAEQRDVLTKLAERGPRLFRRNSSKEPRFVSWKIITSKRWDIGRREEFLSEIAEKLFELLRDHRERKLIHRPLL